MRRLFLSVLIAIGLITIGIKSFAETEQQVKQIATEGEITDNSNFLTIKDEKGEAHLVKTIAVFKFSDNGIMLEIGKAVSIEKNETAITEDKTFLE